MNQNLKNNPSEEIDLIQLFGFFEQKIKSVFKSIFKVVKSVFDIFIAFLKILQKNAIKIATLIVIATVLGFAYDMYKPKVYSSTMMVKPMFDSKYQLFSNIKYYNALIGNEDLDKLSKEFEITKEEAANLSEFIMTPGPENENEKIRAYDEFIKSVDSSTAKMIDYESFIDQMSVYNSSIYEVTVKSKQQDIFEKLYPGFVKTFETPYSIDSKKKKDSIFKMKRTSLLRQIKDVESLQEMYTKELSKEQPSKITNLNGTPVVIGEEQKKTREFDAFQLSLKLRDQLTNLEKEAIEEDKLFEVISDFPAIGTVENELTQKMKFMFPLAAFILTLLAIFGVRLNNFIKNYKA